MYENAKTKFRYFYEEKLTELNVRNKDHRQRIIIEYLQRREKHQKEKKEIK